MSRLSTLLLAFVLIAVSGWTATTLLINSAPSVDDLAIRVHVRLDGYHDPYTPLGEVAPIVQQATVVTEDKRFYTHPGIDLLGILRAIGDDVLNWCLCQGGSTLTQQLAKQIYLDGDDASPDRKLEVLVLAIKIERRFSKDEILEFYLNTAYYGHGAYGVGAAAQTYWRRSVTGVDLSQAALLAGLPQAPSDYDPLEHPLAARERRAQVLNRLLSAGLISAAELERADAQPVI